MNKEEKAAWSYIAGWAFFAWVNVQDPETMIVHMFGTSFLISIFEALSVFILLFAFYVVIRRYLPKKYQYGPNF